MTKSTRICFKSVNYSKWPIFGQNLTTFDHILPHITGQKEPNLLFYRIIPVLWFINYRFSIHFFRMRQNGNYSQIDFSIYFRLALDFKDSLLLELDHLKSNCTLTFGNGQNYRWKNLMLVSRILMIFVRTRKKVQYHRLHRCW